MSAFTTTLDFSVHSKMALGVTSGSAYQSQQILMSELCLGRGPTQLRIRCLKGYPSNGMGWGGGGGKVWFSFSLT